MPGSHWMIVMSPENFEITRERGFDMVGLKSRHRKKAERMALGDRVLFYVAGSQVFPLTATVNSTFFSNASSNTSMRSALMCGSISVHTATISFPLGDSGSKMRVSLRVSSPLLGASRS